jgi:hypothetical protein
MRRVALLAAFALLLGAGTARADSYCVDTPGCDHDEGNNLQTALTDAQNHAGEDTVRIGNATESRAGGFTYTSPDAVHIQGTGGRDVGPAPNGGTTLKNSTANPFGETVLKVLGSSASTISGIDISVPGSVGNGNAGLETAGGVDNVLVNPALGQNPAPNATGVLLRAGGSLTNSDVLMSPAAGATAVEIAGGPTAVEGVTIDGAVGFLASTGSDGATIRKARIAFSVAPITVTSGTIGVEDSLMVVRAGSGSASEGPILSTSTNATLNMNHVTLIGTPSSNAPAFVAVNNGSGTATVSFRNGIVTRFPVKYYRQAAGSGPANVAMDYSENGGAPALVDTGPGAFTETNHLDVPPGFESANDYHLRPDSPLVDAGDPSETGGLDGNGDCVARRDVGAFEFTPGPRAPRAVVSSPFDASASCDPDGDALTFAWAFDDGASAAGAVVQHTFAKPGPHSGTVTVTDSTGRSATATASVVVPAPPFGGVSVGSGRLRVSKQRLVRVAVGCPASAVGLCAGRFTLAGKSVSFFFSPKSKHKLSVKLSKATFKKLKKKKQLAATARAVAHDGNGSAHTTTAKITLLRPR